MIPRYIAKAGFGQKTDFGNAFGPKGSLEMKWKALLLVVLAVIWLGATVYGAEREMTEQIEYGYSNLNTPPNQQKFLSILIFIIFGGATTYAVMRGLKKIAHSD